MSILREYKCVVFWLIFMSLWIIGCLPECKEEEEGGNKKNEKTSENNGEGNNYNNENIENYNNINNNIHNRLNQPDNIMNVPDYIKKESGNINNYFFNQNADINNLSNNNSKDYNDNSINNNNNNNLKCPQNQKQDQTSNTFQDIKRHSVEVTDELFDDQQAHMAYDQTMNMYPNLNDNDQSMNNYMQNNNLDPNNMLLNNPMPNNPEQNMYLNPNNQNNNNFNSYNNQQTNMGNNQQDMNNVDIIQYPGYNNQPINYNMPNNPEQNMYLNPNNQNNNNFNSYNNQQTNMGNNQQDMNNVNIIQYPANNMHMMNNLMQNNNPGQNINQYPNYNQFNKNFNNIQQFQQYKKKPIEDYKNPTLIGLQNIGATCFMNATIQCLSQTEDLTNYFLDNKRRERIIKNNVALQNNKALQLSPVYLSLLQELWNKNKYMGWVNPQKFMKTIEGMNELFKLGQPGDSKDFIIFILEQFHRELKKVVNNNNNIVPTLVNQYDQQTTFQNFLEEFKKDTSVISDVFYGLFETNNICLFCKQNYSNKGLNFPICYNYQIFNSIIFPLQKVKEFTRATKNNNTNKVTIYDCFQQYQEPETFSGENRNYCNICKQLFNSLYTTKIYSSPNVLVLILNRGKNNEYNIKLDFYNTIDITNYVTVKEKSLIYDLHCVITHYGESGPNAHFLAFCKSPVDKNWYRYNDAVVSPIKNFKEDVIDFGNPYILFYKKR